MDISAGIPGDENETVIPLDPVSRVTFFFSLPDRPIQVNSGMRTIRVVSFDPGWDDEFRKIRVMIEEYIGDLILGIEHVGSTAVHGLAAKPIIDLDVIIGDMDRFPLVTARLEEAGFVYQGDLGISGREAFQRIRDDGFMPYHLYVCPIESRELSRHIRFRNFLRSHPETRDAYGFLKEQLASRHPHDIDQYLAGKGVFIEDVLEQAGDADILREYEY